MFVLATVVLSRSRVATLMAKSSWLDWVIFRRLRLVTKFCKMLCLPLAYGPNLI